MLAEVLKFKPQDPVNMMLSHLAKIAVHPRMATEAAACFEPTVEIALRQASAVVKTGIPFTEKQRTLVQELHDLVDGNSAAVQQNKPLNKQTSFSFLKKMREVGKAPTLYGKLVRSKRAAEMLLQVALEMTTSAVDNSDQLIGDIMTGAANLLMADRCTFFLVDGDELVSKLAQGEDEIRIPIGTGLAGHVARTGERINIKDAWSDPRFNRSIDDATGYKTATILCMPVKYEGHIVAVAQLLNKKEGVFELEDEELFEAFSTFAGVCIRNSQLYQKAVYETRKNELFIEVLTKLSTTDIRDVDSVVTTVVQSVTELLVADRCTLYMFDKEYNELVSKVATNTGTSIIRVKLGQGIAGHVAETGEPLNIRDAYADSRFSPETDIRMGYVTRTILAMPIKNSDGEVVAVTQVINKLAGNWFNTEDEALLQYFSLFAGIAISNSKLYEFVRQTGEQAMELFQATTNPGMRRETAINFYGMIPNAADLQAITDLMLQLAEDEILNCTLPTFNVHTYSFGTPLHSNIVPLVASLFKRVPFYEKMALGDDVLLRFLVAAKRKYRSVPYHNFIHAFDITQTVYTYLYHYRISELLEDFDCFTLMVSAFMHDIDHMGLNNSFHLRAETPLGVLSAASGAKSVLEVHHCNLTIELLSVESCNVFRKLSVEEQREAYKNLINNILATDMSRHMEFLQRFQEMTARGYDKQDPDDRRLLTAMILKCADISNVSKPFEISRLWGILMTEEFLFQGDVEKSRQLTVTPAFNREQKVELAKSQLGFINNVVWRLFELVTTKLCTSLQPVLDELNRNREKWMDLERQHAVATPDAR
eukprot:TRINITY_DN32632_c0_g1_i1.p1 TRINITY_DN32632_c0_g1~~TRINITY_DN32632_c0_g1_i1.p1  ORF type:complete len:861 (-),score=172.06 TRINITY_DN32632_c0_g1_i1:41-2503(-)